MVAARIHGPFVVAGRSHERARIAPSSQGGLAMPAIVHSPPSADSTKPGRVARIIAVLYFPYCATALPIDGAALARSCGFIIGRNETFALKARNQGSATAGISDESFISNTIEPDRWPLSSAKK